MTCIIALKQDGTIYMSGDSAGTGADHQRTRLDEKVFLKGSMIMGFTSSFRMGQILQYSLTIPDHREGLDDFAYMCHDFVKAVRYCFRDNEYSTIKENVASGGIFLVGYRGNIYKIESDFQVGKVAENYDACGIGEYYALGSMASNAHITDPIERLTQSLDVASHFSAGVRGPYVFRGLEYAADNEVVCERRHEGKRLR